MKNVSIMDRLLKFFGHKPPVVPKAVNHISTKPIVESSMENNIKVAEPVVEEKVAPVAPSKFAVLIGINKYDPSLGSDLNGCVNDVESMYKVLVETYGFPPDNIRMLTDFRATKAAIIDRIEWLLTNNAPGDELVLHYSGHGSQVRDRNGDELVDGLDEILCPTDLNWDDPLTDDTIAYLFKEKPDNVFLTFICDSCHSGSISRDISESNPHNMIKNKYIPPPSDIAHRSIGRDLPVNTFGAVNKLPNKPVSQKHALLSGCRDNQTSADAFVDGKYQGALTSSLIKAINNNPHRSLTELHAEVISILNVGGYKQKPQLSGNPGLIKIRNIFGSK